MCSPETFEAMHVEEVKVALQHGTLHPMPPHVGAQSTQVVFAPAVRGRRAQELLETDARRVFWVGMGTGNGSFVDSGVVSYTGLFFLTLYTGVNRGKKKNDLQPAEGTKRQPVPLHVRLREQGKASPASFTLPQNSGLSFLLGPIRPEAINNAAHDLNRPTATAHLFLNKKNLLIETCLKA
jgi:hypothetical protein